MSEPSRSAVRPGFVCGCVRTLGLEPDERASRPRSVNPACGGCVGSDIFVNLHRAGHRTHAASYAPLADLVHRVDPFHENFVRQVAYRVVRVPVCRDRSTSRCSSRPPDGTWRSSQLPSGRLMSAGSAFQADPLRLEVQEKIVTPKAANGGAKPHQCVVQPSPGSHRGMSREELRMRQHGRPHTPTSRVWSSHARLSPSIH
jgi:hypothetical protein